MKLKNQRRSRNVEDRTKTSSKDYFKAVNNERAFGSDVLKEKTPIRNQRNLAKNKLGSALTKRAVKDPTPAKLMKIKKKPTK